MENIKGNLERIKREISTICAEVGRDPAEVRILAATKTRTADIIDYLDEYALVDAIGENKVQEFREKYHALRNIPWHFIGQLQKNKVKYIVGKAILIHSVDRIELAREISRRAQAAGVVQDVLIEVNVGGEVQKGGVAPDDLDKLRSDIAALPAIRVVGMMSVLPAAEPEVLEPLYIELQRLFESRRDDVFTVLSAGMSGDYAMAVRYGSNMIRLGTALFGERIYTK